MAQWPANIDGLRFGFQERKGKRFVAVRVQYGSADVVLPHEVAIDSNRHLGAHRLGPEPLVLGDAPAGALLGDMIDANREQAAELTALREKVRLAIEK